jgi:aspartate dehydrogenase
MRVALIGCGAIGRVILKALLENRVPGAVVAAAAEVGCSPDAEKMSAERGFPLVKDPLRVLDFGPDLVIEAAGQEVVLEYAERFLQAGRDLMVLSIGALVDGAFLRRLLDAAEARRVRLIVPSGAIGGLDTIKSASQGELTEVSIVNIKPPQALAGAPFIVKKGLDLFAIRTPTLIYEGFADEAAREFPKNLNVTVALSLAGIGPEKTRVQVIVDPSETRNIHEITAKGDFGEALFRVASLPSPDNPKTSHLAALSAVATLRNLASPLQVGT